MSRLMRLIVTAALSLSLSLGWPAAAASFAFTHVNVVDVERGGVLGDQTVLIDGNRIRAVGPTRDTAVPAGSRIVIARGKYLIPGLWDMHVHALRLHRPEWMFPLFVATGVTGIRDTGSPLADLLHYRAEVADGRLLGPRIFGAGPLLDAPPGEVPELTAPISTAEDARRTVDSLADAGVDFIKVYDGLSRDAFHAIMQEAKSRGVPVIGHVPFSVTAAEASDAGLKSIEHLKKVPDGCVPDALNQALKREWHERSGQAGMTDVSLGRAAVELLSRRSAGFDQAKCVELGKRFARNGTWQVPTLESDLQVGGAFLITDERARDPMLRYVPRPVRAHWDQVRASFDAAPPLAAGNQEGYLDVMVRVLKAMKTAGDGILAGTDTDGNDSNVYGVPGVALHREMEAFVHEAGFTPFEALQTATINPARFFGKTDSMGTVAPGKLADLVLLDANPLDDITNARRISAVVVNGRLLDRKALNRLLARQAAKARQ